MVEEIFVVTVSRKTGGSRGMWTDKDAAVTYAEQTAADPEVEEVEVRVHNTLDLINAALEELEDALREDPDIENGELLARFIN